jgi:hypothetical protein
LKVVGNEYITIDCKEILGHDAGVLRHPIKSFSVDESVFEIGKSTIRVSRTNVDTANTNHTPNVSLALFSCRKTQATLGSSVPHRIFALFLVDLCLCVLTSSTLFSWRAED